MHFPQKLWILQQNKQKEGKMLWKSFKTCETAFLCKICAKKSKNVLKLTKKAVVHHKVC